MAGTNGTHTAEKQSLLVNTQMHVQLTQLNKPTQDKSPRIEPYIWYIGNNEKYELLIDTAIKILLENPTFNTEIWEQPEYIKNIYDDKNFGDVVKKMQNTIKSIDKDEQQHFNKLKEAFKIHPESYLYSFLLVIGCTIKYLQFQIKAMQPYDIKVKSDQATNNQNSNNSLKGYLLMPNSDAISINDQDFANKIEVVKCDVKNDTENTYRIYQEYVRKFVLEYENEEICEALWPWYENTENQTKKAYAKKLEIYKNQILGSDDSGKNSTRSDDNINSKYRYLRKFAAMFVMGEKQILKYLSKLEDTLFNKESKAGIRKEKRFDANSVNKNDNNANKKQTKLHVVSNENREEIAKMLNDSTHEMLYRNQEVEVKYDNNADVKSENDEENKYENDEKIKHEDNQKVNYGVTQFQNIFRTFPEWWQKEWWQKKYDQILLELALKYQLNTEKYIDDLDVVFRIVIGITTAQNEENKQQFKDWYSQKVNVLHRLRYVLYTIVGDNKQPKSMIFLNDKMKDVHIKKIKDAQFDKDLLDFIEKHKLTKHKENLRKCKIYTMVSLRTNIKNIKPVKVRKKFEEKLNSKNKVNQEVKNEEKEEAKHERNVESEFRDIVQLMDPALYGERIYKFIMNQMVVKQQDSLWIALTILIRELPTNIALRVIEDDRDKLRRLGPNKIYYMCRDIIVGSNFPIATSLYLSKYFEKNKENDPLNEEWMECAKKCENIAMKLINTIESDHLLALLLEAPSDIGQKQSAFRVALEKRRLRFFGDQRMRDLVTRLWFEPRFLDPSVEFKSVPDSWVTIWGKMMQLPTRFYSTPAGYYYVSCFLYTIYLVIISLVSLWNIYPYSPMTSFEIVLWIIASQFVLYEIVEFKKKGVEKYFGNKSGMNQMDATMSVIWIILFLMRMNINFGWFNNYYIFIDETASLVPSLIPSVSPTLTPSLIPSLIPSLTPTISPRECIPKAASTCANASYTVMYMILWSIQMIIAWLRIVTLFRMGPLLRIISVILVEIYDIVLITMAVIIGYMFALYYVAAADDDFDDIFGTAMFCWKMLLGQQEWDALNTDDHFGGFRAWWATAIAVSFTIIVTILVFNVLLSFMVMKFEDLSKDTDLEDVFLQAELSYDIIDDGYAMPAPFNGMCLLIWSVIQLINAMVRIFSCCTRKWDHVTWCLSCCDWMFTFNLEYGENNSYDTNNRCCPGTKRRKRRCCRSFSESIINLFCCVCETDNNKDNYYCKYCHFKMKNDNTSNVSNVDIVQKYIDLNKNDVKTNNYKLDKDDVKIVQHAFNRYGSLCSKCYRPFVIKRGNISNLLETDRKSKSAVSYEIIGCYIYLLFIYVPLFFIISCLAALTGIKDFLSSLSDRQKDDENVSFTGFHTTLQQRNVETMIANHEDETSSFNKEEDNMSYIKNKLDEIEREMFYNENKFEQDKQQILSTRSLISDLQSELSNLSRAGSVEPYGDTGIEEEVRKDDVKQEELPNEIITEKEKMNDKNDDDGQGQKHDDIKSELNETTIVEKKEDRQEQSVKEQMDNKNEVEEEQSVDNDDVQFDKDLLDFIQKHDLIGYKDKLKTAKIYTMESLKTNIKELKPVKIRKKFKEKLEIQ